MARVCNRRRLGNLPRVKGAGIGIEGSLDTFSFIKGRSDWRNLRFRLVTDVQGLQILFTAKMSMRCETLLLCLTFVNSRE